MDIAFLELAGTCVVLAGLALVILSRAERTQTHALLLTMLVGLMAWSGGQAVFVYTKSGPIAHFAMMVLFLGVFIIPPVWLVLAAHHTRLRLFDERPALLILVLVPTAMSALAVVTNPGHRLFLRDFDQSVLTGPAQAWAGPFFWLSLGWSISLMFVGVGLYAWHATKMLRGGQGRRGAMLLAVVLLPAVLAPITGIYLKHDLTSMYLGMSAVMLFMLDWRHRVLETLPVARRDVIEQLGEAVVLAGLSGDVIDVNPAAEKLFDSIREQLSGQPLINLVGDLADEAHHLSTVTALDELVAGGPSLQVEFKTADGRFVELTAAPVSGRQGDPIGFYVLLRNRTDERRFNEVLRQSQQLKTTASLSGGIAHEIKNPLAFVQSNLAHIQRVTEYMARESTAGSREAEELSDLSSAAEESLSGVDRILGIIDRMRRFSRLQGSEIVPVQVNEVVQDAVKMARLRSGPDLKADVSLASGMLPIMGSSEHLVQALLNLIDNARHAMQGQADALLTVSTLTTGTHVEIHVRDNGPGIPEEIQERIFDPFYTTKGPGEGTGIGLAISFGIIREHGGSLDLESTIGAGTEFTIRLPVEPVEPLAPEAGTA